MNRNQLKHIVTILAFTLALVGCGKGTPPAGPPAPQPEPRKTAEQVRQEAIAEAEQEAATLIAANPDNARARTLLATGARLKGDTAAAAEYLNEAIRLAPDDAEAHNNLGNIYREQNQFEAAEAAYRAALAIDATYTVSAVNLADLLKRQNRLTDAAEVLKQLTEHLPGWADGWVMLARAYLDADAQEAAQAAVAAGLKRFPDYGPLKQLVATAD